MVWLPSRSPVRATSERLLLNSGRLKSSFWRDILQTYPNNLRTSIPWSGSKSLVDLSIYATWRISGRRVATLTLKSGGVWSSRNWNKMSEDCSSLYWNMFRSLCWSWLETGRLEGPITVLVCRLDVLNWLHIHICYNKCDYWEECTFTYSYSDMTMFELKYGIIEECSSEVPSNFCEVGVV